MTIAGFLTVTEIAKRTDRDPETVRRWIRAKRLPATKIGTVYFVAGKDFLAFKAPIPRGRYVKARSQSNMQNN